jgi:sugar O-acyltransferase (sialic acid O-acetyltransferase NeuD family)
MQMKPERLILVGGGAFSRELINWADHAAAASGGVRVSAFLDDTGNALEGFDYGLAYLGSIASYEPRPGDQLVLGISEPAAKKRIVGELTAKGAVFASLVHPTAVVARTAALGKGVVLCPYSVISADVVLGDFVAVNTLSSVGHDAVVGDYSTLSAHVDLTGRVKVGVSCFFGTGARVLPRVVVGDECRIGAGATVMRNVASSAVMYTMPAKKL